MTEVRAARLEDLAEALEVRKRDVAKFNDRILGLDLIGGKDVSLVCSMALDNV